MMYLVGIIGSFLLAVCAVPEVVSSVKKGYCGASLSFLLTWLFGELFTLVYICQTSADLILIVNYSINTILILILLIFKSKEKSILASLASGTNT